MYKFANHQKVSFDCYLLKGEGKIVGLDTLSALDKERPNNWIVQVEKLNSNFGPMSSHVDSLLKEAYPFDCLLVSEEKIAAI
jgi:hypothetical protein